MYYCCETSTWATVDDLNVRYGGEYIDKISTRVNWDPNVKAYVASTDPESRLKVLSYALCDAKEMIIKKLKCKYSNVDILSSSYFPALKQWHIRLTIETLKIGGDCTSCECNADLDKYIDCGSICNDEGVCLISNKTFIEVSKAHFPCECLGSCKCC